MKYEREIEERKKREKLVERKQEKVKEENDGEGGCYSVFLLTEGYNLRI